MPAAAPGVRGRGVGGASSLIGAPGAGRGADPRWWPLNSEAVGGVRRRGRDEARRGLLRGRMGGGGGGGKRRPGGQGQQVRPRGSRHGSRAQRIAFAQEWLSARLPLRARRGFGPQRERPGIARPSPGALGGEADEDNQGFIHSPS